MSIPYKSRDGQTRSDSSVAEIGVSYTWRYFKGSEAGKSGDGNCQFDRVFRIIDRTV